MNITYLFGAGASAKACPILDQQAQKMYELANQFLDVETLALLDLDAEPVNIKAIDRILFDIGKFGKKGIQYGTIDTYAKKLFLSDDYENQLDRLKISVSLFFTIWESMSNDHGLKDNYKNIDQRYISLLASILEKTPNRDPSIKQNIKFITWNYDLQFERAFKSFCMSHLDWKYVSKHLKFRNNISLLDTLDICHLNGYNGFYYTGNRTNDASKEVDTVDRNLEGKDVISILKELEFCIESESRGQLSFNNHINYAWETNPLAEATRNQALGILEKTDILIIVGYSFPTFNKEIDQKLFEKLEGRRTRIFYQDPNASKKYISILTSRCDTSIECITDKLDYFFLPYDF